MINAITTKFFDSVSQLTQAEAPWEIVAKTIFLLEQKNSQLTFFLN